MVTGDYLVSYEVDCNPIQNNCYVGCDNEDCTEEYYYAYITRHNNAVEALCGTDITNCADAQSCSTNESKCSISFCSDETCDSINTTEPTL